jgi:hypothetical protein
MPIWKRIRVIGKDLTQLLLVFLSSAMLVSWGCPAAYADTSGKKAGVANATSSGKADSAFVKGTIMRKPFLVKAAFYEGGRRLLLRTETQVSKRIMPDTFEGIELDFPVEERLQGEYIVTPTEETMNAAGESQHLPVLLIYHTDREGDMDKWRIKSKYTLKLKFFKKQNGLLPGYIDLNAPAENTSIKGFFYAAGGQGW